jgi:hypothetical protein
MYPVLLLPSSPLPLILHAPGCCWQQQQQPGAAQVA